MSPRILKLTLKGASEDLDETVMLELTPTNSLDYSLLQYIKDSAYRRFAVLQNQPDLKLYWIDYQGDEIGIYIDDDIPKGIDARIYIKMNVAKEPITKDGALASDVQPFESSPKCSECKGPLAKYRFKCVQCFNFYLCRSCEMDSKHDHHILFKLSEELENKALKSKEQGTSSSTLEEGSIEELQELATSMQSALDKASSDDRDEDSLNLKMIKARQMIARITVGLLLYLDCDVPPMLPLMALVNVDINPKEDD